MQQEGESKGSTTNLSSSPSNNNDGSQISYDEDDELIDMEMEDECASDEEIENQQRQQQYLHRQWQYDNNRSVIAIEWNKKQKSTTTKKDRNVNEFIRWCIREGLQSKPKKKKKEETNK